MNRSRIRNRNFLLLDVALLLASAFISYCLRFEGLSWWPSPNLQSALLYVAVTIPLRIRLYLLMGLYRRVWEQASIPELEALLQSSVLGAAVTAAVGLVLPFLGFADLPRVPISVLAMDALFTGAAITIPRYLVRLHGRRRAKALGDGRRVLIAGAGNAGQLTAREIRAMPQLGLTQVGFLDDDPSKLGRLLETIPVVGRLDDLAKAVKAYEAEEVIIAMPRAAGRVIRRVVRAALDAGVETRTVPGIYDILSRRVHISALRSVEIQDLLRRAPIETDIDAVRPIATDQTVLITGAGGSIGSELCRQIALLAPAELVLLGHGENSIFEVCQELRAAHPKLRLTPVIADIRDSRRINDVIAHYSPNAIFHAAAHKHVPLMEGNVVEAVTNNVLGTRNVLAAAEREGVPYFVLISSDKAVRPSSVMGATKRVAEQLVQLAGMRSGRSYVSVRFGNVLGSRGSVIPTFLSQIRSGGPVMVTHPDMCRYFITIPEAVQLVLQACALSRSGEVFMLDMGEPVRIVDLATDLIRLSGLQVGTDVEIRFSGMRPGEKLFEEMFSCEEEVFPTGHPKVLRARQTKLPAGALERMESLFSAVELGVSDGHLRHLLRYLVPDFTGQEVATPLVALGRAMLADVDRVPELTHRGESERATTPGAWRRADMQPQQRAAGDG